ncbi:MAG: preprotein translocase subunit SecE [Candidatus Protochlamydia sp.]|nr:preprotein translocase subunit SecE [Candidatus Protochlamydia sp.]
MEIKKPQISAKESTFSLKKVRNFVDDVKSEIFKINWTNREELIVYTKIVVMTTFLFGMSIYLLDLLIQGSLSGLSFMLRWISG